MPRPNHIPIVYQSSTVPHNLPPTAKVQGGGSPIEEDAGVGACLPAGRGGHNIPERGGGAGHRIVPRTNVECVTAGPDWFLGRDSD